MRTPEILLLVEAFVVVAVVSFFAGVYYTIDFFVETGLTFSEPIEEVCPEILEVDGFREEITSQGGNISRGNDQMDYLTMAPFV